MAASFRRRPVLEKGENCSPRAGLAPKLLLLLSTLPVFKRAAASKAARATLAGCPTRDRIGKSSMTQRVATALSSSWVPMSDIVDIDDDDDVDDDGARLPTLLSGLHDEAKRSTSRRFADGRMIALEVPSEEEKDKEVPSVMPEASSQMPSEFSANSTVAVRVEDAGTGTAAIRRVRAC